MELLNLPFPNVIEELSFDEISNNIKKLFLKLLNDDEIALLESDNYSCLLEALAYREMILRARINSGIKAMLLPYATGSDLDNVVSIYGITRLKGAKPLAKVRFELSAPRDSEVVIPKDLVILSSNADRAVLKNELIIPEGGREVSGVMELDRYEKTSDIKCEYIQTPLPFLLNAKQESKFSGGSDEESDEALRKRALLSLKRFSTAGSKGAYEYHSYSANAKVEDVSVKNGGAGIVNVYIKSSDRSDAVLDDVRSALNDEKARPLTDLVNVANAGVIETKIKAVVELENLSNQGAIDGLIKSEVKKSFKIGEDLNLSYLYRCLHQAGVYRAKITLPTGDILADEKSFIKISSIDITYQKAVL